jgi:peptidoglycan/xylan/chitin deacetylase (PgdA/CDA1 family)
MANALAAANSPTLLIVNFHRIRPANMGSRSAFDDGVFGPDVEEFRRQMDWLRSTTIVLDEEGVMGFDARAGVGRGTIYSAVTFDDAYVDCFSIARPILESFGIRAMFFIPVGMIDSRRLGWWDLAAYVLKRSTTDEITIAGERLRPRHDFVRSCGRVFAQFKLRPASETNDLLECLSSACGVALPGRDEQSGELMTWEHVRQMRAAGHGIGSHSLSHRVLATLPPDEQHREITESRRELEARLDATVHSFAYPVGGPQHIDRFSPQFVREAGYRQAFTFNTGVVTPPIADRFRIPRESAHSFDLLRAKALMPRLMGLRGKQAA